MSHLDIIRAWKDEEYLLSLSEAERALLPAHPAGLIELTEWDLAGVDGAATPVTPVVTVTIVFSLVLCGGSAGPSACPDCR